MGLKSQEQIVAYHGEAKLDWSLNFHSFSMSWIIIIWCTILLGFLALWLIQRAWRRWRAINYLRSLGATYRSYPPNGAQVLNTSCPICLEDFAQDEEVAMLPCGHMYKPECLRKQINTGYLLCSICRGSLV